MIYWNCLKILEACCEAGLIQRIHENAKTTDGDGNIVPVPEEQVGMLLIYRSAGKNAPEGWYTEDIDDVAQNLMKDRAGQKYLLTELKKKGITPELIDEERFHRESEEARTFLENLSRLPSWQN